MTNQENISKFESLLKKINRPGIDDLIDFCRKTDFYIAPSSTRYHLCVEGGLLQHSLNVYNALKSFLVNNNDGTFSFNVCGIKTSTINEETLILISLLHDICKVNYFGAETRNRKNKDTGQWEQYKSYVVDERFPYGHGEKSVLILSSFISLMPNEQMAIRWHMGFPDDFAGKNAYGCAVEKYPIVLALHTADMMASRLMESNESNKKDFV